MELQNDRGPSVSGHVIRKITLHNYMSHAHSVIELTDGLTALIGPNNCGKSAIVDAIQTVCENVRGSYMVKHGENECSVVIETSEGDTVEWRRRGATVKYVVNGKEFDRLNGG